MLGTVYRNKKLELVERYLGLRPSNEDHLADQHIMDISKIVEDQVDLDQVAAVADFAQSPHIAARRAGYRHARLRAEDRLCQG